MNLPAASLTGKHALITGSTSGIGLGIARALAVQGCDILLNGFGDSGEIEVTRKDLAESGGAARHVAATAKARGISDEEVVRNVMLAAQPTKQLITIEQVAALALYLCSDSASAITGAVLSIDGGWTAK
jgi:NAD(P)-dependent dehydrogenase (short-subunit alcohol dehydrogenase family)